MSADPVLVDVYAAAAHIRLTYRVELSPATIRQWASRGHIDRHGKKGRRLLVDLAEIDQRVETTLA